MSKLEIDLTELDKEISNMKTLLTEYQSKKPETLAVTGKGKTKKRIKKTTEYLETIEKDLGGLIQATILLLENEKQRYAGVDEQASLKVKEMDKS